MVSGKGMVTSSKVIFPSAEGTAASMASMTCGMEAVVPPRLKQGRMIVPGDGQLAPEQSAVAQLRDLGHDVWAVDFGAPEDTPGGGLTMVLSLPLAAVE